MASSWVGAGCVGSWAVEASEASWVSNKSSGTWTQYQGHDLVVVVAKYKPKNTTITNSELISVTTTSVPIRNYATYGSGSGFYYVQDSSANTIDFLMLYCADLDVMITYTPVSGSGGARIKDDVLSSRWYKTRRAQGPQAMPIISVSGLLGPLLELLKQWITSGVGIAFSLLIVARGFFGLRSFINGVQADRTAKWLEQQEKQAGTHRYKRFRNKKRLFNHLEKSYREDVLKR